MRNQIWEECEHSYMQTSNYQIQIHYKYARLTLSNANRTKSTFIQIQRNYKYISVRTHCLFRFRLNMCHLIFPIAIQKP